MCLHHGIAAVSDVVDWANAWVAASPTPHGSVCELCIAGRKTVDDVIDLLHDVPGEVRRDAVDALVFAHLTAQRSAQQVDDLGVATALCRMGIHVAVGENGQRWSGCFHDELESPELYGKTREVVLREMQGVLSVLSAGASWESASE